MEEKTQKLQKLKYRLIESSSEDSENRLYELIRGADSFGWVSVRFCTYPQEILLQFLSPVNLKQIHILSHEKKITSMIEIFCYYPSPNENLKNYKSLSFEKLGYIRLDTNSKTNYKAREFRKIYIDTHCYYLKLLLNKNYVNKYNVFNQVGLISIDFYGTPIETSRSSLFFKENLVDCNIEEDEMDDIAQEKIKILRNQQEDAIKIEDYDEAKKIKKSIDRIKIIGRKIYELESQKKIFINSEDYDNAKIMKLEIDRLKSSLKYLDRQLSMMPVASTDIPPNEDSKEPQKEILIYKENTENDETVLKEKSFIEKEKDLKDLKDKEK
jgi:centrosomal protein CEP104